MKIQNLKFKSQNYTLSGQIVLIIVLITFLGVIIGLSLISRSITDVRISSQIEQSNRAFSAAEAGVETAMNSYQLIVTPGVITFPGASARYEVSAAGGNSDVFAFPAVTEANDSVVLWLVSHNDGGDLIETLNYPPATPIVICWKQLSSEIPAVIVTLSYKLGTNYKIAKGAYDPTSIRSPVNNFISAETDITNSFCNGGYRYRKSITPTVDFGIDALSVPIALRIQPIYDKTNIAVAPNTDLPVQGKIIRSTGQTSTNVARKIIVYQGYSVLPLLVDFALFNTN